MACEALGRCRICARKHKIAVFGGEKSQHFFIEKANLKLIILNTVCIVCIGKMESFVKKMGLDMISSEMIIKSEVDDADHNEVENNSECETVRINGVENKIRTESSNLRSKISSPTLMQMDIDGPASNKKFLNQENESSNPLRNFCNGINDVARDYNAHARPKSSGDSLQQATESSRHCLNKKIGQDSHSDVIKPHRKRLRSDSNTRLNEKNSKETESSSLVQPSHQTIAFVDCGSSNNCSSNSKKIGRFLGCDYCGKEFTHAGDLNKHRRKHTGEKPYECNQCKRKFAHASNLARHQRVHSGERPFACKKCAKTFTRRDKLTIHVNAARCQQITNNIDDKLAQIVVEKMQT